MRFLIYEGIYFHDHHFFKVVYLDQVKRWPPDLAFPGSLSAGGGILFKRKRGAIAHSLSLSLTHRPDMVEIQLKRT